MTLDYETLKFIWWLFIGVLLIGFAVMDGFDMGIGALLPFVGKTDEERRVLLNVVGPTWEGNQVWLVTAGGALFAAWPLVYATAFSGFYFALILVLFALFLRPVGFDYRSKLPDPRWRSAWDWGLFVGGAVPALVFGVAFGNLLQGAPFHFDPDLRSYYTGSFFALLNPYALLCGIVSLSMLIVQGAVYLQLRTEGIIAERCKKAVLIFGAIVIISFAAAGVWTALGIEGYRIVSGAAHDALPNPLGKTVEVSLGGWMENYAVFPWLWIIPALAFATTAAAMLLSRTGRPGLGFIASSLALACIILTAGFSMYPFLLPSSTDPNSSLTIWDSSSSLTTLKIMFWVTLIFLPIVIAYTSWAYRVMRGKVTVEKIRKNQHTAY
ncbi:MAG: cytochrome d ubiquinol oxidase subunit II [Gammaproteobacteria bacterium]